MLRTHRAARAALLCLLALSPALPACEDENDPKTWVGKLSDDAKRIGAAQHLRQIFQGIMSTTTPPNNTEDPRVKAFLAETLPALVPLFSNHAEDGQFRQEVVEIFADSRDPAAIPGLQAALRFRPGNTDSQRVALRAAQALKEQADRIPANKRDSVVNSLLAAIDQANGRETGIQQIRYNAIQTLGKLKAPQAAAQLELLLLRPLSEQDINTARAAADALGEIGAPSSVDALVYGLYLNVSRQNAFPHCERALARIGAEHAVPKLVATLQGQNARVEALIAEYRNIPGAPPPPDGLVRSTAADVLTVFASPLSLQALLQVLANRQENANVRAAAAEALSYIALGHPEHRAAVLTALTASFNEQLDPTKEGWTPPQIAPRFALIGEPSTLPLVLNAVKHRALADVTHAGIRAELLLPLASMVRHGDVAQFDLIAGNAKAQLEGIVRESPGAEGEVAPYLRNIERFTAVANVARECNDGDLACYQRKLADANDDVVRKAAYLIAWTTPAAQSQAALDALYARLNHGNMLVRRSIMVAIDRLSPDGNPQAIQRLEQLIESERGQESKIVSHLDALLLISRLRARALPH